MAQNSEAQKVILINQALAAPLDLGRVGRVGAIGVRQPSWDGYAPE
jgi:hypothetical protein